MSMKECKSCDTVFLSGNFGVAFSSCETALRPAPPNSKKRRSPRARRHRSKEDSVGKADYVTKGDHSPRVAMLNRYGDIVQTNLPVIPNQRWVQVNPLAKG